MADRQRAIPVVGKRAPAFTSLTQSGDKVKLSDFKGKNVVLYFYPKDNTPGCTIEAQEFRDVLGDFEKLDAVVLGASPDSEASHCKFIDKFDLNFTLLSDPEHVLAEKYGAWGEKKNYGKTYMGIIRSTILIDAQGKVAHVWPTVKAKGHAAQVLETLRELS